MKGKPHQTNHSALTCTHAAAAICVRMLLRLLLMGTISLARAQASLFIALEVSETRTVWQSWSDCVMKVCRPTTSHHDRAFGTSQQDGKREH